MIGGLLARNNPMPTDFISQGEQTTKLFVHTTWLSVDAALLESVAYAALFKS